MLILAGKWIEPTHGRQSIMKGVILVLTKRYFLSVLVQWGGFGQIWKSSHHFAWLLIPLFR